MACSCVLPPPLRAAPCDGSEARRVCVPQLAEKLTGLERGTRRSVTRAATLSVRTSRQASFARGPAQPCARFYCALPTFAGSSTTCWGACCVLRRRLASGLSHGSAEGLHGDQQPRRRRHCTATPSRVGTVPPSPLYSCFLRLTDTLRSLPAPSQNDDRIVLVAISNWEGFERLCQRRMRAAQVAPSRRTRLHREKRCESSPTTQRRQWMRSRPLSPVRCPRHTLRRQRRRRAARIDRKSVV